MSNRKYAAFISYRHLDLDMAVAQKVHKLVEQYVIPKELRKDGKTKFGYVFRDQEELAASQDLSADIREALANSEYLILICTPETKNSKWVLEEINYFIKYKGRDKIFIVLADGKPSESFPYQLTHVDNKIIEPLALNIVSKNRKDVFRKLDNEIVRLYAAMLGCNYDDLIKREQKRRSRRIINISAAIMVVLLGFISILTSNSIRVNNINNRLIEQQKLTLQKESQLLTEDAMEYLEANNYSKALRYALDSLPYNNDIIKPYYVPAERVLFKAMDVFSNASVIDSIPFLITDTKCETDAPVKDYCISSDGNHVFAVDEYGTVYGYESSNGNLIWKATLDFFYQPIYRNCEIIENTFNKSLYISSDGHIWCMNIATGKQMWHQPFDRITCSASYIDPNNGNIYITVQNNEYDYNSEGTHSNTYITNTFMCLSAEDGSILYSFVIDEYYESAYFVGNTIINTNGKKYISIAYMKGNEIEESFEYSIGYKNYDIIIYLFDLEKKIFQQLYSKKKVESDPFIVASELMEDNNTLMLITAKNYSNDIEINNGYTTLDKINVSMLNTITGKEIWSRTICINYDEYNYYSSLPEFIDIVGFGYVVYDGVCGIALSDKVFFLDYNTGKDLLSLTYKNDICSIFSNTFIFKSTEFNTIIIVLKNGQYHQYYIRYDEKGRKIIVDATHFALFDEEVNYYTSAYYSTNISRLQKIKRYGDGLSQFYNKQYDRSVSNDFLLSNLGFAVIIESSNDHYVIIKKPIWNYNKNISIIKPTEKYNEYYSIETKSFSESDYVYIEPSGDIKLLCGHRIYDNDGIQLDYCNTLLSFIPSDSSSSIRVLDDSINLSSDNYYCVPNSNKIISYEYSDGLIVYDYKTKKKSTLFEGWGDYKSTNLFESGDVFTVKLDEDKLIVWLNDEEQKEYNLPEIDNDIIYSYKTKIGKNGLAIIYSSKYYNYNKDNNREHYYTIYNCYNSTFTVIHDMIALDEDISVSAVPMCIADKKPLFATLDVDGIIRCYNVDMQKYIAEIDFPISISSISEIQFINNDEYLSIVTKDKKLFVIRLSDGVITFEYQLNSNENEYVHYYYNNHSNNCLFIMCKTFDSSYCLYIDMNNWELLAEIDGFIAYIESTNEVLLNKNNSLYLQHLPSIDELIIAGHELID